MLVSKISRHCVAAFLILTPATSFAGPLLGSSVTATLTDFGNGTSTTGIAGTDSLDVVEHTVVSDNEFDPTFTASTIGLAFSTTYPSGGYVFVAPSSFEITGIDGDIVSASGATSFTDHSVTLDLSNQFWFTGQTATIDLQFAAAVPEPSGLTMLGSALFGLALLGVCVPRRDQT
jgi:hypothetical protein